MNYVLIFISLTLAAITAFQFLYLFFLERVQMEHKKKVKELERLCKTLNAELRDAKMQIAENSIYRDPVNDEEVWADVID